MAQEKTFPFDFSWFRATDMKNCFKCGIEFKWGDVITRVRVTLKGSHRSRNYHKACWEKVLQ